MITFEEFIEKIRKAMCSYCGKEYQIEIDLVRKNNGAVYHGLTVMGKERNVFPTIYVDELYQEYADGMSFKAVMDQVIGIYEKHKIDQTLDVEFLTDYEWVKERVLCRLIGYEKNRELLMEVPHIGFLDMAIVFYCRAQHDALGSIMVLIKNGLCRLWEADAEELMQFAEKNTPRILPPEIISMKDITGMEEASAAQLYVLGNQSKQFGAVSILYPDVLKRFSEKVEADVWILPSSVHEVILMPKTQERSGAELKSLVAEINRTQIAKEEVLTDSVYFYERETFAVRLFQEDEDRK